MRQGVASDARFKYFYDRVRAYEFSRLSVRRSAVIDEVHEKTVGICRGGNDIHTMERQTAVALEVYKLKTCNFGRVWVIDCDIVVARTTGFIQTIVGWSPLEAACKC